MKLDTGSAVVILAVLIFYLRLIILQRERVKRSRLLPDQKGKKKKSRPGQPSPVERYSILSRKPVDLIIAGFGFLAILMGVVLNAGWIALPVVQPYWWIPAAAGLIAFSWAFKL